MENGSLLRKLGKPAAVAVASLLILGGTGSVAFAGRGGGVGGGFHGGGFRGGAVSSGGFRGGYGYRGYGYRGYGYRGYGYRGYGYRGYGGWGWGWGWGWGPWWGLGLYLPVLPWYYSTFWWDGVPYYYADNGYYIWDSDAGQYEQVQPPAQVVQHAQDGQLRQTPPELFAYPKNGQTAQQQATDKRECSRWASSQTGLYPPTGAAPTAPGAPGEKAGNVEATPAQRAPANSTTPASAQQQQNYMRAESACLQARGYSVD